MAAPKTSILAFCSLLPLSHAITLSHKPWNTDFFGGAVAWRVLQKTCSARNYWPSFSPAFKHSFCFEGAVTSRILQKPINATLRLPVFWRSSHEARPPKKKWVQSQRYDFFTGAVTRRILQTKNHDPLKGAKKPLKGHVIFTLFDSSLNSWLSVNPISGWFLKQPSRGASSKKRSMPA